MSPEPELSANQEEGAERNTQPASEISSALSSLPENQREAARLTQIGVLSVAEAALKTAGALKIRAYRGYRGPPKALEGQRVEGEWKSEGLTGEGNVA